MQYTRVYTRAQPLVESPNDLAFSCERTCQISDQSMMVGARELQRLVRRQAGFAKRGSLRHITYPVLNAIVLGGEPVASMTDIVSFTPTLAQAPF